MLRKLGKSLFLFYTLLIVSIGSISFAAQDILFTPQRSVVEVDEIFEVNLTLGDGVVDLFAYTTHVKFDTNLIQVVDAFPSQEWLSLSGTDQYFVGADSTEVNPETQELNWYYHVFDVLFTIPKKTIDGYTNIATLRLKAKQPGISRIYYEYYKGSDTLLNSIIIGSKESVVYICPFSLEPGDVDGSSEFDISDLVYFIDYMFGDPTGPEPVPILLAGDANCDTEVDISDLVHLIDYMFNDGPGPCDPCL